MAAHTHRMSHQTAPDVGRSKKLALFVLCIASAALLGYVTLRYNFTKLNNQPDPNNPFRIVGQGMEEIDFSLLENPAVLPTAAASR